MPASDRVQGFLNGLSVGVGAAVIRGLLAVVLAGAGLAAHARLTFRGLNCPAAMEQAEIARALAGGRGFVTRTVRPFDLHVLSRAAGPVDLERVPATRFAPAYSALLSVCLPATVTPPLADRCYGPEWRLVAVGSVLTLLTAGLVFLLGRVTFTTRTGLWAALVYLVTDAVPRAATSGLVWPLLTGLGTLAALLTMLALRRQERGAPVWQWLLLLAAAGVTVGLAMLSAYLMVLYAVLLAVFVGIEFRQSRAAAAPIFLACALLVGVPWAIRNYRVTGNICGTAPAVALNASVGYPERSLERQIEPELPRARVWSSLRGKLRGGLGVQLGGAVGAMGGVSAALFLAALFHAFRQPGAQTLKWCTAAGIGGFGAAAALVGTDAAGLHAGFSLLPLIAVFGVAGFHALLDREEVFIPQWQALAGGLLIVLAAAPLAARLAAPAPSPYPPYYPPFPHYVARLMLPGEAICSDIPEAVAWYGDRTAVLVPETLAALRTLRERHPRINAVYLTSVTSGRAFARELVDGRWADWLPILQQRCPAEFPFPHAIALPPGTHDQLFLTDRDRWQTAGPTDFQAAP
jgi:hypothetical protein